MNGPAPLAINVIADLCFVVACAAGCVFVIASSLRFGTKRSPILDQSISVNAYSLYLVHYDFVIWLQIGAPWLHAVCSDQGSHRLRRDSDPELDSRYWLLSAFRHS